MAPSMSSATLDPLPPPRRARIPFPSLAFANHALKSPPSPPSTTTSPLSDFSSTTSSPSSSASSSMSPISSASSYASCAFPDWPKADVLSPPSSIASSSSSSSSSSTASSSSSAPSFSSAYTYPSNPTTCASSYITDEDLLDLATLPLYNNIRIPPELLIAPTPMAAQEVERESRRRPRSKRAVVVLPTESKVEIAMATTGKRRRASGSPLLKRRKLVLGLSPVAE